LSAEAQPATPTEAAFARGVEELLHYTTQKGVHGTVAAAAILSRARLDDDEYLEHIRKGVWPRKDHAWIDHISLSVTSINSLLWNQSRWHHPDMWWAVFSVSPRILDDDGVWFTTTNNIFPSVCRGQGVAGFEAMFADPVVGRNGVRLTRAGLPRSQPTDRAAEVLYPARIPTDNVERVYVAEAEHRRYVLAWCDALEHRELCVEIRPDIFA
jgi:hypothetical protein